MYDVCRLSSIGIQAVLPRLSSIRYRVRLSSLSTFLESLLILFLILTHPSNRKVTSRAIKFIHNTQRPDGSWFGSWGICFTYATMFALESLALNNETYSSSARVRKACHFLRSKQKLDGGWGETYMVRGICLISSSPLGVISILINSIHHPGFRAV